MCNTRHIISSKCARHSDMKIRDNVRLLHSLVSIMHPKLQRNIFFMSSKYVNLSGLFRHYWNIYTAITHFTLSKFYNFILTL